MTIKKKIYSAGGAAFIVFIILALMNIWTHQQVLSQLQVQNDVNEKLANIKEFAKWKYGLIGSVSDIVASGHVPPYAKELFNPPFESHTQKSEALIHSGKTLVGLIGEKEHAQIEVEKTYGEFRRRINDIYYKLDKKIATVLAGAQLDKIIGIDSSNKSSLAPYVLKSLNQLTLVASNSLIERNYTEEKKGVIKKNKKFLSAQLHMIDEDGSIAALFKELFSQIESLEAFILDSRQRLAGYETTIANARDHFNATVAITEIDTIVAGAQSEVMRAHERLERASRRTLATIIIFLFIVPVIVIVFGIFGLNTVIVAPITHLVDAMRNVEGGNFDVKAPEKTKDEIGILARAFNAMAEEINAKVTELSQLNRTLKESESKYRTLVDNLPQRIFLKDKGLVYVSCNHKYAQDLGIKKEEIVGKTDWEFFPKPVAGKYRDDDARILLTEKTEEIEESYTRNGTKIIVQTVKTPVRDEKGNIYGVLGIFWDITKRKRAEEALRESRERLETIFNSVQAGILIVDRDSHVITDANRAAIKMIGMPKDGLIGHVCHKHICLAEEGQCPMTDQGACKDTSERVIITSDGTNIPVMKTALPIMLDGRAHLLESFIDISMLKETEREKERLQSQLRQASKMEAIGTLAGGIAHDFNNILSAISGYTELALLDSKEDSHSKSYMKSVLQASTRAKNLVEQILTFSRQNDHQPIAMDLAPVVKESLKLLRATVPTTIEIKHRINGACIVVADPTQMQQVVMNLCTNAAQAMRQMGGILDLTIEPVELDEQAVRDYFGIVPGNYVLLRVGDTGSGIEPDVIDKIYDPFFTTKRAGEGTGMGLSVVHGIVKSSGGNIKVDSKVGEGSTFKVLLPRVEEKVGADPTKIESIPMGNERILFVDDEESLVNIAQNMLERLGYQVKTRTSSIKALAAFQHNPDGYDLVMTDMTMPNMTGESLAKELLRIRPDIPIIICTGFSYQMDQEKALGMGISAFVMKPFVLSEVGRTIRNVLDAARN
jgi:PAS domain S-box-containing protein